MAGLELLVEDAAELSDRIRDAGVILRAAGQKIVMSPPLVIEKHQLDRIVDVLATELERTPALAPA
jgi:adenosylmethionine-8-amino-7-oxononanoate aminotransferase